MATFNRVAPKGKRTNGKFEKVEYIVPPTLAFLAKIAEGIPVPYAKSVVEVATCIYKIATVVPRLQ